MIEGTVSVSPLDSVGKARATIDSHRPDMLSQAEMASYQEYLQRVTVAALQLCRMVLPDMFRELDLKVTFSQQLDSKTGDKASFTKGLGVNGIDTIEFRLAHRPTLGAESLDAVAFLPRFPDSLVGRELRDVITFVHEYAHGIFDALVIRPRQKAIDQELFRKYFDRKKGIAAYADGLPSDLELVVRALDEGFALFVEDLALSALARRHKEFGLTVSQIDDLNQMRSLRRLALKANRDQAAAIDPVDRSAGIRSLAYNEGHWLIRQLYAAKGEQGLARVLEGLDAVKIATTLRTDPQFQAVLQNPESIVDHFGLKH